ncbi:MAG: Spy/CpxP family protein refolding chaperone [bacterium]|nr:MAG: Spy/CpxP family protein refolding chaperone [bacterium]
MSKKTLTWLLIFSIIINISTITTFSYHRWFKPKKKIDKTFRSIHRESLSKKLGLTEEQSQKVRELRSDLWKEIKPLRIQLSEERRHFIQILKQDTINIDEVYKKVDSIAEIQQQMQRKTVENMLAHQSILTPEQRKIFFTIMTRRMQLVDSKKRHVSRSMKEKNKKDHLKLKEEKLP